MLRGRGPPRLIRDRPHVAQISRIVSVALPGNSHRFAIGEVAGGFREHNHELVTHSRPPRPAAKPRHGRDSVKELPSVERMRRRVRFVPYDAAPHDPTGILQCDRKPLRYQARAPVPIRVANVDPSGSMIG